MATGKGERDGDGERGRVDENFIASTLLRCFPRFFLPPLSVQPRLPLLFPGSRRCFPFARLNGIIPLSVASRGSTFDSDASSPLLPAARRCRILIREMRFYRILFVPRVDVVKKYFDLNRAVGGWKRPRFPNRAEARDSPRNS